MTARPPAYETTLRRAVLVGIALVLLTPFVITPGTVFPFVVGKAVWSRSTIEVVFALWAVLALARPAWRPPRTLVLPLLAAGLGVALLAAFSGVSLQRSLWSDYERMQGVVDLAHWFAFAVVLVSMLRTGAAWRRLLAFSAGTGTAMACLAIARQFELDVPFYGNVPERDPLRIGGPLGNPVFLGVHLLANFFIAAGFAVRSWLPETAAADGDAAPCPAGRRRWRRGAVRPAWALAAGLQLWGLTLAGSVGAFAGLFAGAGALTLAGTFLAGGCRRRAAAVGVAALALAAVAVGFHATDPDRSVPPWLSNPAVQYVAGVHVQRPGVQARLTAWEAGLAGFAERPLLGWGPGNFGTVFGRFATGYGAVAEPHDQAHGKLVETAATQGALGLAAYLGLWSWCFVVLWRAARAAAPRERATVLAAGVALAGALVQSQSLFDTAAGSLVGAVLIGFAAGREAARSGEAGPGPPAGRWRRAYAPALTPRGVRLALGTAALSASAAGFVAHQAALDAADMRHMPRTVAALPALAEGIDGFPPLAYTYRMWLFDVLAVFWERERAKDGAAARRLLDWAEREAARALAAEPERWRIHHSLARLYRAAARTDPEYRDKARRALERARTLAPGRDVFPAALAAPAPLGADRTVDGGHALRWRGAAGAGYHVVQVRAAGRWQPLLHAYDPGRTAFVRPGPLAPGTYRYRLKACRSPGKCAAGAEWPPLVEPPPETGAARP